MRREALRRRVRLRRKTLRPRICGRTRDIDDCSTRPSRRPRFGLDCCATPASHPGCARIPWRPARLPSPFQIRSTRTHQEWAAGSERRPLKLVSRMDGHHAARVARDARSRAGLSGAGPPATPGRAAADRRRRVLIEGYRPLSRWLPTTDEPGIPERITSTSSSGRVGYSLPDAETLSTPASRKPQGQFSRLLRGPPGCRSAPTRATTKRTASWRGSATRPNSSLWF